jgi:hypothetical protein
LEPDETAPQNAIVVDEDINEEVEPRKREKSKKRRRIPKQQLQDITDRCKPIRARKLYWERKDANEYNRKMNAIKAALTQKSETFLKKRSDAKKGRLVESKDDQELQYKSECTIGWDISPKLFGKIKFSELNKTGHLKKIETELQTREAMPAVVRVGFKVLVEALKKHETRLLKEVNPGATEADTAEMAKYFKVQTEELDFGMGY